MRGWGGIRPCPGWALLGFVTLVLFSSLCCALGPDFGFPTVETRRSLGSINENNNAFGMRLLFVGSSVTVPVEWRRVFSRSVKRLKAVIPRGYGENHERELCLRKGDVFCGHRFTKRTCIKDVLVLVSIKKRIDGIGGVLARAAPCGNDVKGRVRLGYVEVDGADFAGLVRMGKAFDVVTHELIHALGFGARWEELGLISRPSEADPVLMYVGPKGKEALEALGGQGNVFIANGESEIAADRGHFSESTYGTELMTGHLDLTRRGSAPLSKLTLGALRDLGYSTVDLFIGGEPYTLPEQPFNETVAFRLFRLATKSKPVEYKDDIARLSVETIPYDVEK